MRYKLPFKLSFIMYTLALFALPYMTAKYWADLAINGYTPTDFLGMPIGETVYGWDAITGDSIGLFIFIVIMLTATIYQIIYAIVQVRCPEIRQPIGKDSL